MKVVVVGGTGFLGENLCRYLTLMGHDVTSVSRRPSNVNAVHSVVMDVAKVNDFRPFFDGAEVVYHLANTLLPTSSNAQPLLDIEQNLVPALKMGIATADVGVRRLIFASSGGTVYGEPKYLPIDEDHSTVPKNSYGILKLAVEQYYSILMKDRVSSVSLRISNPYGPGQRTNRNQGVVGVFLDKILRNERITLFGNGKAIRDFVYIDDVVSAFGMSMHLADGVYNVGSGEGTSVEQLIKLLEKVTGRKAELAYEPSRASDVCANVLDTRKFRSVTGWFPAVSLEDGLCRTYAVSLGDAKILSCPNCPNSTQR